jgi:hypothetical protein
MASNTRKVTNIRESKVAKAGAKRKNKVRRLGTTAPGLPLTKPNANEIKLTAAHKAAAAKVTAAKAIAKTSVAPKAAKKAPAKKA